MSPSHLEKSRFHDFILQLSSIHIYTRAPIDPIELIDCIPSAGRNQEDADVDGIVRVGDVVCDIDVGVIVHCRELYGYKYPKLC